MSTANKMICPNCGAEMNHHAMKVAYDLDQPVRADPIFGGVLNEVHTCPACGTCELRHVEPQEMVR